MDSNKDPLVDPELKRLGLPDAHSRLAALINQCSNNGGTPSIDSRDSAGVNGATDSGAAKKAGGYRFECQK